MKIKYFYSRCVRVFLFSVCLKPYYIHKDEWVEK